MLLYTKSELDEMCKSRLEELLEHAGSQSHLARMIGKHQVTVVDWVKAERVSKSGAKLIGNHPTLGELFPAEYLRPDLEC